MIDACFGISVLLIAAYVALTLVAMRAKGRRIDALRECADELCRLSGRFEQIERAAAFGVDVETRARMHEDLIREKDEAIARHRRAFPEIPS